MQSLNCKRKVQMIDRWYQSEAVDSLFTYFATHTGNPLICLPTGSGKSYVIARFLYRVFSLYPHQRVIIATHVKELVEQNYNELLNVWQYAPAGIYSAGLKRKEYTAPITFAGVGSIVNAVELFGHVDLLMIDEAHLLGTNADGQYMRLISTLRLVNPALKVIGLTATAWRTGMGMLTNGEIFTDIAYDICNIEGFKRLFADGYLVPPRTKRVDNEIDVSNVRVVNGDFSKAGLEEITKSEKITWDALNESLRKNPDRNCRLVFCTGVAHAELAAQMLRHIGLTAAAVHSKMSTGERDEIIKTYRRGELDVLTNNGIFTTGQNHKPIDHIIMLRPTMSVGLWVQMLGRGMRPFEGKSDCIVSDHAGNARRLGPVDDPYIPKMKGKGAGDMPVKICDACDSYNHARAVVCVFCGQPFELKIGYKKEAYADAVLRSDLQQIETFNIDGVFYTIHNKLDAGPNDRSTIKAVYKCGLHTFKEFIAFEAIGYAQRKAREWWQRRCNDPSLMPTTSQEALGYIDKLIPPKAIKVWVNKKYPEITSYEF